MNSPLCLGQGWPTSPVAAGWPGASTGAPCVAAEAERAIDNRGALGAATAGAAGAGRGAADGMLTANPGADAEAITGAGAATGAGAGAKPSSCRIKSLMGPDKSVLHSGQINRTGSRAISGVTSMAYFEPHGHWTFITTQGLGFNNTMGLVNRSGNGAFKPLETTPPSHDMKLPPPLP